MRRSICALLALGFIGLAGSAEADCGALDVPEGSEIVEFSTTAGPLCMRLLRDEAPETVANFLDYLNRGDYADTIVHRSATNFVIQGGAFRSENDELTVIPTDLPVVNEPCTPDASDGGLPICSTRGNDRATVAMARSSGINSATNQWFINLKDNRAGEPRLDTQNTGFTVFAVVVGTGMQVADAIDSFPKEDTDKAYWLNPELTLGSGVFDSLPVHAPVALEETLFGCFDPAELALESTPENPFVGVPDPETGDTFFYLSGKCGELIPEGSFTPADGTAQCPDPDRVFTGVTGPAVPNARFDSGSGELIQYRFTCEQTVEALVQRSNWRADYKGRFSDQLVVVETATVTTLPEPNTGALGLAATATLAAFRARKRRRA